MHPTCEHPFLTDEHGFTPAGQLTVGMYVQRANDTLGVITAWKPV